MVSLPPDKNPIDCKWIYKLKYKANGTLKRQKVRLVYMRLPHGYHSKGE